MSSLLIVDDDRAVAAFVAATLTLEGFHVVERHDGMDALETCRTGGVDLLLLDVDLPRCGGIEVCRRLRADASTASIPIIMLTAADTTADKVLALQAGADDYLVKPFDTLELLARVRATLRRNSEMRAVSPLTGLPGNVRIDEEIADRHRYGEPYAVAHLDLDNFKAFNDAYGFLRGDAVIRLLARCLREAAAAVGGPPVFTGHIGGDDFAVVCTPEQSEPVCRATLAGFDAAVLALHDPADVTAGIFHVLDRQGHERTFPLVSVSVGIALSGQRRVEDPRELAAIASEMKAVAKSSPGSTIAVDRRAT
jgi:DNA-binding response OmpR family regulator